MTKAHAIVARVCNENRNSDLRADNRAICAAFDEALDAKDAEIERLTAACAAKDKALEPFAAMNQYIVGKGDEADAETYHWQFSNGVIRRAAAALQSDAGSQFPSDHAAELDKLRGALESSNAAAKRRGEERDALRHLHAMGNAALAVKVETIEAMRKGMESMAAEHAVELKTVRHAYECAVVTTTALRQRAEILARAIDPMSETPAAERSTESLVAWAAETKRKAEAQAEAMRRQMLAMAGDKGSLASALACERSNYAEEIKLRQTCERLLAEAKRDTARLEWLGYTAHGFVRGTDISLWKIEAPSEGVRTIRAAIDAAMRAPDGAM